MKYIFDATLIIIYFLSIVVAVKRQYYNKTWASKEFRNHDTVLMNYKQNLNLAKDKTITG